MNALSELFIKRVKKQVPYFRRVLIETTGLADPAPVIHMLMTAPVISNRYALDGIITTVDAVNAPGQLDRHEESVKQAAVADRIVITKSDLVEPEALDALSGRLDALNPGAPKVFAVMGEIDPEQLFDTGLYDPKSKTIDVQRWLRDEAFQDDGHSAHDHGHGHGQGHGHDHHGHDHAHDVNRHDESIAAFCVTRDEPIGLGGLRRLGADPDRPARRETATDQRNSEHRRPRKTDCRSRRAAHVPRSGGTPRMAG